MIVTDLAYFGYRTLLHSTLGFWVKFLTLLSQCLVIYDICDIWYLSSTSDVYDFMVPKVGEDKNRIAKLSQVEPKKVDLSESKMDLNNQSSDADARSRTTIDQPEEQSK